MTVLMELKRIIINEIHDQQIIMLNEVDGDRAFPIVIGLFEALSIDRRIKAVDQKAGHAIIDQFTACLNRSTKKRIRCAADA